MASDDKDSNPILTFLQSALSLSPTAMTVSPENQNSLIETIGSIVGPIGDVVTSNKPAGQKALELGGFAAEALAGLPAQLLVYSPKAEAAFVGPKGIKRLERAGMGDKLQKFASKFFGERAEINPPDMAQVAFRFGAPLTEIDNILKAASVDKYGRAVEVNRFSGVPTTLDELIPDSLFNELYVAYPELRKAKVELVPSKYEKSLKAEFIPARDFTPWDKSTEKAAQFNRVQDKLEKRFARDNPEPEFRGSDYGKRYGDWLDARREYVKKTMPTYSEAVYPVKNTGSIRVQVPETISGDNPSVSIAESLMHEVQHFIQSLELWGKPQADMKEVYKIAGDKQAEKLTEAFKNKDLYPTGPVFGRDIRPQFDKMIQQFAYRNNPFEREARDAAARDVMSSKKRNSLSRRTEKK